MMVQTAMATPHIPAKIPTRWTLLLEPYLWAERRERPVPPPGLALQEELKELPESQQRPQKGKVDLAPAALQAGLL